MADEEKKEAIIPTAYTILGHGENSDVDFIVPDDCMVITITHPGKLIYSSQFFRCIRNIMKMKMDVLLNPLRNKNILFKNFQGLKYYKPGSKCPNFTYQMSAIFNTSDNNDLSYLALLPGSGLTNVEQLQKESVHLYNKVGKRYDKVVDISSFTFKDVKEYLESIYDISTYPTKAEIHNILKDLHAEYIRFKSIDEASAINNTYLYGLKMIYNSKHIIKDQESLCRDFPGIYYNFVCRDIKDLSHLLYNKKRKTSIVRESIPKVNKSLTQKVASYNRKLHAHDMQRKHMYNQFNENFRRQYESLKDKKESIERKLNELKGKNDDNSKSEYYKLKNELFLVAKNKADFNDEMENIQAMNNKKMKIQINKSIYVKNLNTSRRLAKVFHNRISNFGRKEQARNYYTSEEYEQDRLDSYKRQLDSYNTKEMTPSLSREREQLEKERASFIRNYDKTKKYRL